MAAVIRYLSADNHMADTPPLNSPETGPHRAAVSLFRGLVFEMSACPCLLYVTVLTVCVGVGVYRYYRMSTSSKKYFCSSLFLYLHIHCLHFHTHRP